MGSFYRWFYEYCDADIDDTTTYYAKDICSECDECFDPLIANTSPPTVSSPPTVTLSSSPTLSPTVSSPPTPKEPLCIGVRNKFKAFGGDCSKYFGSNLQWCKSDVDDTTNNYT